MRVERCANLRCVYCGPRIWRLLYRLFRYVPVAKLEEKAEPCG